MKITFRLGLLAAGLALAGSAMPQVEQPPEGRIAIRVEMVNLLCTVIDRRGLYVTNLTQDDFIVYENNAPQKIENFSAMTDLPLSIALLIDTSASVANKLKFEQDAAAEFFATMIRPQDKALLVEFDTGVTLIQDFTNDANILARQLRTLRAAGGTSLYDAVLLVAEEKLVPEQGERRKTVIVISDGEDTVSKVTFEEALEMAQRSGATIFAISTNKGGQFGVKGSDEGDAILEQLTSATGGKAYYPSKLEDLGTAFKEINQELRSQYSISYRTSNPLRDGTFRSLRVSVKGKDLRVRHRKGYFAPKGAATD
jgi:Ca-activated chloride channel family protein